MASHEESRERENDEMNLSTETVQSAALSFEGVDDIEGGDGLSLGVLRVGDCVSDDAFEEGLQDTAGLLVDHCDDGLAIVCDAWHERVEKLDVLAEIRLTPPRRARRRMAGLVMPWMLSRRIFR